MAHGAVDPVARGPGDPERRGDAGPRGARATGRSARAEASDDTRAEGANFQGANITGGRFDDAILTGATFVRVRASNASFRDTQMRGAVMKLGQLLSMDGDATTTSSGSFYTVVLKNFAAPWTNRDQTAFVPLNDYTATIIGMVWGKDGPTEPNPG